MSWFKLAMALDKCGCRGERGMHNSVSGKKTVTKLLIKC
jgi:hypothetical protein